MNTYLSAKKALFYANMYAYVALQRAPTPESKQNQQLRMMRYQELYLQYSEPITIQKILYPCK